MLLQMPMIELWQLSYLRVILKEPQLVNSIVLESK
ncbi:MAG TPA: hypothetical protein [Caudoviricetes sp.]|nr:MAG TPA: hypothetical protein [Caudoviricetes sp.]